MVPFNEKSLDTLPSVSAARELPVAPSGTITVPPPFWLKSARSTGAVSTPVLGPADAVKPVKVLPEVPPLSLVPSKTGTLR